MPQASINPSPVDRFAFLAAYDPLHAGDPTALPLDSATIARHVPDAESVSKHPHAEAWKSASEHLSRLEQVIDRGKLSDPASRYLREHLHACRTALSNVETAARALKAEQDSVAMPGPSSRVHKIAQLEGALQERCLGAFAALNALASAVQVHADALAPDKVKIAVHSVLCAAALIALGVAMFATQGLALVVVMALAGFAGLNGALGWAEAIRAAMEKPLDTAAMKERMQTLHDQLKRLSRHDSGVSPHSEAAASEVVGDGPMDGDGHAAEIEPSAALSDPCSQCVGDPDEPSAIPPGDAAARHLLRRAQSDTARDPTFEEDAIAIAPVGNAPPPDLTKAVAVTTSQSNERDGKVPKFRFLRLPLELIHLIVDFIGSDKGLFSLSRVSRSIANLFRDDHSHLLLHWKLENKAKAASRADDIVRVVASLDPLTPSQQAKTLEQLVKVLKKKLKWHQVDEAAKALFGCIALLPDRYRCPLLAKYAEACCYALGRHSSDPATQALLKAIITDTKGFSTEAQGYALIGLRSGIGWLEFDVQRDLAENILAAAETLPEAHRHGLRRRQNDE